MNWTVKDLVITIVFLGSILLAILGGWNYMKGRIFVYQEQVKIDQMQAAGNRYYDGEAELKKIRREKNKALLMFAAGVTGFFIVLFDVYRRRKNPSTINYKTNRP